MNKAEKFQLRKNILDNVVKTLLMGGEKIKRLDGDQNKAIPFSWDDRKCLFSTKKLVRGQDGRYYIPVEYATDTHADLYCADDLVVVNYEDRDFVYRISMSNIYKSVNNGMMTNKHNFHQTNTGDILSNRGLCVSIEFNTFQELPGMKIYNMHSIRESIPHQYEPLVNKVVNQFFSRGLTAWDQLKSMAYEGLAIAMNTFDDQRSTMNFMQFAAFAIRNNILTSLDNELRTVKLSNYAQKKVAERGESLFNTVSIDVSVRADEDKRTPQEIRLNMFTDAKFSDGDVFNYMYNRLESMFPERDCKIFYKIFGLSGYDEMKGKDVAKEFGISEGLVSQKIKKITSWIRKDNELCEMLSNLVK